MDVALAKDYLGDLKKLYHKEMGVLQQLKETKREKEEEVQKLQEEKGQLELKRILLQEASEEARKQAKEILQDMATRALQFIIGEHMSLEIVLDEKGNSPVANFVVKSSYGSYVVEADPGEEEGGGVADIVSFSTFIAMLQLAGKNNVAPLFLDEPSKYVSKGHSEQVAKFLYDISTYFNRQVFMVTHDEFLANIGDKSYHFQIKDGKTETTLVATS